MEDALLSSRHEPAASGARGRRGVGSRVGQSREAAPRGPGKPPLPEVRPDSGSVWTGVESVRPIKPLRKDFPCLFLNLKPKEKI